MYVFELRAVNLVGKGRESEAVDPDEGDEIRGYGIAGGADGGLFAVVVETSAFRSELTVTNFSEEPRTLDFQFVAEGIETDNKTATFRMTLEAAQQEIIAEVVAELRQRKVSGENPFLAYGVVNDGGAPGERSGDGAYLPARE